MPSVLDWSSYIKDRPVNFLLSAFCFNASSLFFFVSFFSEPQQHIEDRSFSRMLWPNSSVSKEVSGSSTQISPFMTEACAHTAPAGRYIHTWIDTYMLKCTCAPIYPYLPPFSLPIIVHHMHRMSECGWITVVDTLLLHDSGIAALPGSLFSA